MSDRLEKKILREKLTGQEQDFLRFLTLAKKGSIKVRWPINYSDLAMRTNIPLGSLSRIIRVLEQKGLIHRKNNGRQGVTLATRLPQIPPPKKKKSRRPPRRINMNRKDE